MHAKRSRNARGRHTARCSKRLRRTEAPRFARSHGPSVRSTVELAHQQVWGISVPVGRVPHADSTNLDGARHRRRPSVGPAAAQAATEFERLVELVLEALPRSSSFGGSGWRSSKATRQVNTLQLRVEPALTRELGALRAHARRTGARRALAPASCASASPGSPSERCQEREEYARIVASRRNHAAATTARTVRRVGAAIRRARIRYSSVRHGLRARQLEATRSFRWSWGCCSS